MGTHCVPHYVCLSPPGLHGCGDMITIAERPPGSSKETVYERKLSARGCPVL